MFYLFIFLSADAGKTVHNSQPKLDQIMDNIGQKLNLLKHPIRGFNPAVQVIGPGDIEGHLGTDGQYYILDFGR